MPALERKRWVRSSSGDSELGMRSKRISASFLFLVEGIGRVLLLGLDLVVVPGAVAVAVASSYEGGGGGGAVDDVLVLEKKEREDFEKVCLVELVSGSSPRE